MNRKQHIQAKGHILWADDEIEYLKSHILFLEQKGYRVTAVSNAEDAVARVKERRYDLLLLDEMMPGMDGLEALEKIKAFAPGLPVVMVTKSEEENLMEEAIGGRIDDYLTKPVNPSQILSCCMRILEKDRIAREKLTRRYTSEFMEISTLIGGEMTPDDWIEVHRRLSEREVELDAHPDLGLRQSLRDQRRESNQAFSRYIEAYYPAWVRGQGRPLLSPDVLSRCLFPLLREGRRVLFIVLDNLRLDQWLVLEPLLYDFFSIRRAYYFSILPTATPYSRNALFAGLLPSEIVRYHPNLWIDADEDETSLNRSEDALLGKLLARERIDLKTGFKYVKIMEAEEARAVASQSGVYLASALSAMVFNFVDIMAHRRSDSQILKEILPDEPAYRALTRTWFEHSALFQILQAASRAGVTVFLTSDHGWIQVGRGATVFADRQTSSNVRYKYGRGIRTESKMAVDIKDPHTWGLPAYGINTNYLIAREDYYFVYPTNYHKYLALYRNSFQHGGISLEEMILPWVVMEGR